MSPFFLKLMIFPILLTTLFCTASKASDPQPPSADQILKEVEKRIRAQDESAAVHLTIFEVSGSSKSRSLQIQRKSDQTQKVLVRLNQPSDLKGTALLSIGNENKQDQWLYLPSSKQTRRISGGNKNGNFMDSELSYEDLGSGSDRKFSNKLLRMENTKTAVVESSLKAGESQYSKIVSWIPLDTYLVSKVEYYDRTGKLLKTSQMSRYTQVAKGIWRAQQMDIKNAQTQRGTRLELKDLAVNQGIDDQDFSVESLSDY
jgi:outer membrane lipoprotein-sorting protein